ncbi:MAG: universal stress protein [Hyphomicrobiaceae bacterium]
MTYKTILAYLPTPEAASTIVDAALPLAKDHQAHLVGLHLKAYVEPFEQYGTIAAEIPPEVYRQRQDDINRHAEAVRKSFDARMSNTGLSVEWREEECLRSGFPSVIVQHGNLADLIVTVPPKPVSSFDPWTNAAALVVMEAGRPVLLIPESGRFRTVGKRAIVAWNETRESARAAFDSVPLLKESENVQILSIDTGSMRYEKAPLPGEGLALCLARHDITCNVQPLTVQNVNVGEEILGRADYDGVDLVIMGCFGHSRMREYIFGGVTEHVMTHMSVPVLMSH